MNCCFMSLKRHCRFSKTSAVTVDFMALRLYDLDHRDDAWVMAAGLPLYVALFGRDAAAWLQAQQYPQTGSSQSGSSASAQASTVQGCLQGSNGNFTLTDNADTTYQIQGDTSKLTEHVGHEVQITGRTSSSASGSTSGQTGSTSSTPQQPTIELQGVKHIAKTCKSANK